MGFDHRKPRPAQNNLIPHEHQDPCPPPPPLPPPVHHHNQNLLLIYGMIIMASLIGAVFIVCAILNFYYSRQRNARRARSAPIFFGTQEDFLDEDQGPAINHPIWYINTIGLQQSVIDSITVFKYKKDEGLTEDTECSVCLNQFQEDESLRLLPKCSHAFHMPCIDTWLRAHKNCPLCRAPIVCSNFDTQVALSQPLTSDSSSREEPRMENSENNSGFISNQIQVGEDGSSEVRNGDDTIPQVPIQDSTKKNLDQSILRNHSRVQSDLVDTRQALEAEMHPMRRSVSLNIPSASAIYFAVANHGPGKRQGNSDARLVQPKYSKSKIVAKRGSSGKSSFRKLMKGSSIGMGRSLQKEPVSMKRSLSSSGKFSFSRHRRSQNPIHSF